METRSACSSGDSCFIGTQLRDVCHLLTYCRNKGFLLFSDLSENDRRLLLLRTGISSKPSNSDTLCFHHQVFFLSRYESFQKFCCDPFRVHKKHVTKSLRIADATLAEKLQISQG